jgi:hypothetical protein
MVSMRGLSGSYGRAVLQPFSRRPKPTSRFGFRERNVMEQRGVTLP